MRYLSRNIGNYRHTTIFLAVYLFSISAVVKWLKTGNYAPEWLNITLCAWVWLVGPVVLIVTAGTARRELDFENPQGLKGRASAVDSWQSVGVLGNDLCPVRYRYSDGVRLAGDR